MNVLIACEESQAVCTEFRKLGYAAYSCDLKPSSGNHPEWHIMGDVTRILNGETTFRTTDGYNHTITTPWDLIIAHPPCTYLSFVANRHHSIKLSSIASINRRTVKRLRAIEFFMLFATANCKCIAIENPLGVMSSVYRAPDQIIHPYMFASSQYDSENYHTKRTCLWLKNLPPLKTNNLEKPDNEQIYGRNPNGKIACWEEKQSGDRATIRSKTFPGIARAMATQWGFYVELISRGG